MRCIILDEQRDQGKIVPTRQVPDEVSSVQAKAAARGQIGQSL
jgi:hypothetical protein